MGSIGKKILKKLIDTNTKYSSDDNSSTNLSIQDTNLNQPMNTLGQNDHITEIDLLRKRFQVLVQDSNDVFEIIGSDGTIQYVSSAVEKITGFKPEERIGKNAFELLEGQAKSKLTKMLALALSDSEKTIRGDISFKTKLGQEIFLEVQMRNHISEPAIQGIVLNWRDITPRIELRKKITHISTHDELTGLPNRTYFRRKLHTQCQLSTKNKTSFALMMLDIDGFKYINDSLGYTIGDKLIIEISNKLKSFLSKDMFLSRYIGDHFMIIVPNLNTLEEYANVTQDIIQIFSEPFKMDLYDLDVTVSIGVSVFSEDAHDVDSVKNHAMIALARAKDEGKNKYVFYSPQMNVENYKQFILRNDLRRAIEKEQIKVYYQPQINLKTNEILGAEALVRWEHPVWGVVSPKEFIPLAEETGYIIKLGNWILKEVCRNYKKWLKNKLPKIKVAINYSSTQFFEKNFVENIRSTIQEFKLDPHFLIIEITEDVIINNSEQVISHISALKDLGIQIAIDDFGTGYSSLSYLNKFNADILKIDRSFIRDVPSNTTNTKITNAIVSLAQDLSIKLVTEGIETWEQLSFLRSLNCYTGQGFIYSKPVPLDEFEILLSKKKCKPIIANNSSMKPKEERRKFFRVNFPPTLEADMTILELNGKKVQVGNTKVIIKNMGPGGLCVISNINLPIKRDMILQFKTELSDEQISVYGCPVWTEEVDYGLYEYGIEFTFDENDRTELTRVLNKFQIKLRNNPGFREGRFLLCSPLTYFRREDKIMN